MSAATESRSSGGRSLRTRNTERRRVAISSSPEIPRKHCHNSDDEYGCDSRRTKKILKGEGRSTNTSRNSKSKTVSASAKSKSSVPKKTKTRKSSGDDSGICLESSDDCLDSEEVIRITNYRYKQLFLTDSENESDREKISEIRTLATSNDGPTRKLVSSKTKKAIKRASTESTDIGVKNVKILKSANRLLKSDAEKKQEILLDGTMKSDGVTSCANFKNGDFPLTISVEEPSDGRPWYIETTDDERKNLSLRREITEKLEAQRVNEEFLVSRNVEPMSCDESDSTGILDISMMCAIDVEHIIDLLSN